MAATDEEELVASAVVYPGSTEEVQKIVHWANNNTCTSKSMMASTLQLVIMASDPRPRKGARTSTTPYLDHDELRLETAQRVYVHHRH